MAEGDADMNAMLVSFMLKFLSTDALCAIIAKAISRLLAYASKKGGKAWDVSKDVVAKVNVWTSLFMQVYEDDTLDADDEKLIAEAIKKQTSIEDLVEALKLGKKTTD